MSRPVAPGTGRRPSELGHLARRFAAALRPRPPSPDDERWALGWLSPAEAELWRSQSHGDRAHAVAVARRVATGGPEGGRGAVAGRRAALAGAGAHPAGDPPRWLVAAALLHDVGKAEAGLGVAGRTVATVLELAGVRRAPGRIGRYLRYSELGAARLAAVGADERVVAWAREHHRPPPAWSGAVPAADAQRLVAADRA